MAPQHGTEVDMMGVDRLLQSITEGGVRVGAQIEVFGLIIFLQHIYIYRGEIDKYGCKVSCGAPRPSRLKNGW